MAHAMTMSITEVKVGDRIAIGRWRTVTGVELRPKEDPSDDEPHVLLEVTMSNTVEAEFRYYDPNLRVLVMR